MAFPFPTRLLNLLRRTAAPATAERRFDAAAGDRRGYGMGTFHRINSEVAGAGASVRSRGRYLGVNNPWLKQAVDNWAGALVGPGITPTPKHPDAATRKALSEAFNVWAEEADADGRTDFWGLQADLVRGLVIDGEAFLQVITTEDGPRLRLLPPELVDESMTRELSGGALIETILTGEPEIGKAIRIGRELIAVFKLTIAFCRVVAVGESGLEIFDHSITQVERGEEGAVEDVHAFWPASEVFELGPVRLDGAGKLAGLESFCGKSAEAATRGARSVICQGGMVSEE